VIQVKTIAGLFIAVVLALSLTLPLGVTAQSPSPTHQFNESNMHAPPLINILVSRGTIILSSSTLTSI
jgi:hypothetical protein